jgi:copper chaperone CopZ
LIVKKALEGLEGVQKASVSFLENRGEVSYDPEKVTEKEIVNKVNKIGFRAKVIEK